MERRHAGPCAQLCTRQGSCPPRPSIQIGSRDRSASETTTTGSHSLLDSLECRVLIGAVCVSSHASRGCRVICFDHCCLEVCRLSKFSFFDRYLLQSTPRPRSRAPVCVCTRLPCSVLAASRRHFHHSSSLKVHTVHGWCSAAFSVREKLVQRSLTKVLTMSYALCTVPLSLSTNMLYGCICDAGMDAGLLGRLEV